MMILHEKIAADPLAAEHVDLAWATHDTPLGQLMLIRRDDALVRVAFATEGFDHVLHVTAESLGSRTLQLPGRFDDVRTQLDRYFAGELQTFDIPVSFELTTAPFRRRVQERLRSIPFGTTRSYSEVADGVGNPKGVRAVGTACATNPLPIVVPCHRVVRSDGSFGNYLGGSAAKHRLLELESSALTSTALCDTGVR